MFSRLKKMLSDYKRVKIYNDKIVFLNDITITRDSKIISIFEGLNYLDIGLETNSRNLNILKVWKNGKVILERNVSKLTLS